MKSIFSRLLSPALLIFLSAGSERARAQQSLQDYIQFGLSSSNSIKEQGFLLDRSIYALKESKSLFYPNVSFTSTYTRASGGRTIDVPTGDLLNKAYATLNQLTGSANFPQLENQHILLNPNNFYDAKFRTSLPLINAELVYNKRIRGQQVTLQQTEILLYKRELVKEIKKAYYDYAKSQNAINIYSFSLKLVEENRRINIALFNNQKANRTAVVRSENEVSKINAQLISAREKSASARSYFNFLINRPLGDSIVLERNELLPGYALMDTSVTKREELSKLKIALAINENVTGMAKSYIIPRVSTFVDLGSQAFDFKFNRDSRYYLFGLNLEWNLFGSGRNTYKRKGTESSQLALSAESSYVESQLRMQLQIANNDFRSALAQYKAAQSQLRTADQYYKDELRLYKEGEAIYIELLDAQNQLINARLESNIALYDTWIRYAEIERANASFNLN